MSKKAVTMHRFRRRSLPLAIASSAMAALTLPLAATAQSGDQAATGTVEEVVVTARRKDESLSKVPIAVSIIGAEDLKERQVRTDSDLQFAVPGLTIRQTQGNNSLTYSIRGQSADTFSGSPSAVVAYFNEVPITVSGASTFYDLESIQVLKGPQGTLFGRNTTGGAVLYTTSKPTNELEGKLRVQAGNYDMLETEGVLNIPIVDDKILFRGAFNTLDRDGYIDNIVTGKTHGDIGRRSGRLTLTVRPNDMVENTSVYSYARTDGTNTGATYTYSVYAPGQMNGPYTLNTVAGTFFPSLLTYVDTQKALGPYKTSHPYGANHIGEDEIFVNTTIVDLGSDMRLKNIFGYTAGDTDSEQPALGAPIATFATRNIATGKIGNELEVESFSDELQLSGDAMDGRLSYITGIYLQQQRSDTLWPQTYFAGAQTATNNFRIETDTTAVYGQGTYSIRPELRVTAGVRYTTEDVTISQLSESDFYQVAGFEQKQDETFERPSWELGLEWDVSDSVFTYLKTRSSFRSGGFNGSAPPFNTDATGGGNKFDEETVKDVEAGLKFQGELAGRPARASIAIYKEWVKDVQRIEFPVPPPYPNGYAPASIAVTANVPEMKVKGVELDMTYSPAEWLDLGLVGTYTDARFSDGNVTLFGVSYDYNPVANTPKSTGSLWAQFNIVSMPVEMGTMAFRAEMYSQNSFFFSNTADSIGPDTEIPGYTLVNARLSWNEIFGSRFDAALWGKNLTDKEYFAGGMALAASLGHNAAAVGEPRTYGAEITYRF